MMRVAIWGGLVGGSIELEGWGTYVEGDEA